MSELSAVDARAKLDRLEGEKKRAKVEESISRDKKDTLMAFVAVRLGSNVIDKVFPSFAGLKPVAEVAGAAYALNEAFDDDTDRPGAYLGGGLAAGIGIVDKVSGFLVDTVEKFKNKAK